MLSSSRWLRRSSSSAVASGMASLLSEQEVDHPAAPDVRPGAAAVGEDVGVGAAGVLQRVSQHGQTVEGAVIVDGLRELGHGTAVPGQPRRVNSRRAERVAETVAEEITL